MLYGGFLFVGGSIGLYGAIKIDRFAITIYFYWSCLNVVIQVGLCCYIIGLFAAKGDWFWSVLFVFDTLFGIGIWYYLIGVIKRFKKLVHSHYQQLDDVEMTTNN